MEMGCQLAKKSIHAATQTETGENVIITNLQHYTKNSDNKIKTFSRIVMLKLRPFAVNFDGLHVDEIFLGAASGIWASN